MFTKHYGKVVWIIAGLFFLFGNSMADFFPTPEEWYRSEEHENGMLSRLSVPEMQDQRAYENFSPNQYVLRVCHPSHAGKYCEFTAEAKYEEPPNYSTLPYSVIETHFQMKASSGDESLKRFCDSFGHGIHKKEEIHRFTFQRRSSDDPKLKLFYRDFILQDPRLVGQQNSEKLRKVENEDADCVFTTGRQRR